jgi:Uma2 family endonuclease
MVAQPIPHITPDEYLAAEREAALKSEYLDGQIYAMAGASPEHNTISVNVLVSIGTHLKGRPCQAFGSDQRVAVTETGLYAYPDVTVVCGKLVLDDERGDTLLNPTVVIEILSPSTEAWDRGVKAEHYRRLASLQEYLLIAQDRPHVERYVRKDDGSWVLWEASGLDASIRIEAIALHLPLAELYDRVEFGEAPAR